jgi:hypothetical protein
LDCKPKYVCSSSIHTESFQSSPPIHGGTKQVLRHRQQTRYRPRGHDSKIGFASCCQFFGLSYFWFFSLSLLFLKKEQEWVSLVFYTSKTPKMIPNPRVLPLPGLSSSYLIPSTMSTNSPTMAERLRPSACTFSRWFSSRIARGRDSSRFAHTRKRSKIYLPLHVFRTPKIRLRRVHSMAPERLTMFLEIEAILLLGFFSYIYHPTNQTFALFATFFRFRNPDY